MATKRSVYDFYPTPKETIESLMDTLSKYNINLGDKILEPCAGDGALIRSIWHPGAMIQAYDIDESHLPQLRELCDSGDIICYGTRDVLTLTAKEVTSFNTIITNFTYFLEIRAVEIVFFVKLFSKFFKISAEDRFSYSFHKVGKVSYIV